MSESNALGVDPKSLPEHHLIRVLLLQHQRVQRLLATVRAGEPEAKQESFDALRELLAIHETAEEQVLRPLSAKAAPEGVADQRNQEEDEAAHVLAELEKLDVHSADFVRKFENFEKSVLAHAHAEEQKEFPAVLGAADADELVRLGEKLLEVEGKAPTHPHPSAVGNPTAVKVAGPFAAMLDKARDAFADRGH
ncbi:hemerythrin domain-containing protein [Phaeacidiphilus oryzae]|jgi:hemerythrin superfamily protein|uniref:hemerythrin domain-containing protein n=1 Tax=Phaeacidiphilus oryzae TaxID=348818 RepID=UPI00068983DB|nr:hemerythrin domain-containing protein [Phaeacidiphilus oryzae]